MMIMMMIIVTLHRCKNQGHVMNQALGVRGSECAFKASGASGSMPSRTAETAWPAMGIFREDFRGVLPETIGILFRFCGDLWALGFIRM